MSAQRAAAAGDLQAFKTWLIDNGRSEGTARLYLINIRACLADEGGITARLVGTLAPKTMRTNLAALVAWGNFHEDDALLRRLKKIRLPPAQRVSTRTPMEGDEWPRMIEAVRARRQLSDAMRAALLIICLRGLRCSDVLRLRRADVVSALRSGRLIGETKGRKRIEYSASVLREALEMLAERPERWDTITDLLVPTSRRAGFARREVAVQKMERALRACAKEAGIADVYPHRLRRTYATGFVTRLKNDPRALLKLQEHMGWSAMSTAAQYVDSVQREELDQLGDEMMADVIRETRQAPPPAKRRRR
jgi:integrase